MIYINFINILIIVKKRSPEVSKIINNEIWMFEEILKIIKTLWFINIQRVEIFKQIHIQTQKKINYESSIIFISLKKLYMITHWNRDFFDNYDFFNYHGWINQRIRQDLKHYLLIISKTKMKSSYLNIDKSVPSK